MSRLPTLRPVDSVLLKAPTGIAGLDEITGGGLPRGRSTLVCGGPGSGKTLLALSFLINGAERYDEPGVLVTLEQTGEELAADVASLGFDLPALVAAGKLAIDHVHIERSEIEESGEYDLEGLFVRLELAVGSVGAKRVVLDTIESLFGGLSNQTILRAELRRLFGWLKARGLTVVVTGERTDRALSRHDLEEYVSDAVILLDHRVHDEISTRRLRIVKYRGSQHGTNEYPFLIDRAGIGVVPITSLTLAHTASTERISTGVADLDAMLGGQGYYRGSTILVSGTAGTGKTNLAAHFVDAACRRGERCLWFLFEESPAQVVRNMRSIGLDLDPWVRRGLLELRAERPARHGLEVHLATMHRAIAVFQPSVTVVDPITDLLTIAPRMSVRAMLTRLIDHLKTQEITALFTSLTSGQIEHQETEAAVSSLMDSWVLLMFRETERERRRELCVLKSRGMAHSSHTREYELTDHGLTLSGAFTAPGDRRVGRPR